VILIGILLPSFNIRAENKYFAIFSKKSPYLKYIFPIGTEMLSLPHVLFIISEFSERTFISQLQAVALETL
jgi:hypothetical protein